MTQALITTRRALLGLAAVAGLGGGLWWSQRRRGAEPESLGALPADFWSHQFDTLEGTPLKLSELQGRPLLINFWATWCPPCVKEMPELEQFHQVQKTKGWTVLGLAIDGPTPVRQFLAKKPVTFPIGLAGFGGTELGAALGNTAGGLPFTVLIDAKGRLMKRKMGATSLEELEQWAQASA